jgi:ribonuclease III
LVLAVIILPWFLKNFNEFVINTLINLIKNPVLRKTPIHNKIYALTGFLPGNVELYICALTHKSVSIPSTEGYARNNERMEFLGDAILNAVIADYLYNSYPGCKEGFLTLLRSRLVNRNNLNKVAIKMGVDELIRFHKSTPVKKNIYGNALEALIGALYIDKGYLRTKKFIVDRIISTNFDLESLACEDRDFKSQIIQWGQKNKQEISFESFELTAVEKPQPLFAATIHIKDILAGEGFGSTKKEAQQLAARHALKNLPA